MDQQYHHHHEHTGMSSKVFLDAKYVMEQFGGLSGKIILDIGCGDGHFSVAASELVGNSGKIYSIDVDEPSIISLNNKIKKRDIRNITTMLADFTKGVEIENKSVDICLMVNVFHGFVVNKEEELVINEIKRLLKYSGKLFIVEFKKTPNTPGPHVNDRLAADELENILGSYGYKPEKKFEAGSLHYGVIHSHKA
jgi:ubiquinone/menaquinone biosynthesis C-methylase UbiE